MEPKLYARLKERASHVYPLIAPRDYEKPAVVYNRIDTTPIQSFDNDEENGFVTFQVDVYDEEYKTAKALARSIRKHLRAWIDEDGSIQSCLWDTELDMVDDTTSTKLFRVVMRFRVFGTL